MTNSLILKTGRGEFDLLNPRPEDVNIEDMLHNLSRIVRFSGASPMTVLQHSLWVGRTLRANGADDATVLAGIIHDLHEYVTGDIAAPILDGLRLDDNNTSYRVVGLQMRAQVVIESRLGIRLDAADIVAINETDHACRELEMFQLTAQPGQVVYRDPDLDRLMHLTPTEAIAEFRAELEKLGVKL